MSKLTAIERQKKIVEILRLLHEGGNFEVAKKIFNDSFEDVDVTEITSAERELIQSGLDPSEIQKLCNVHAAVFKGSITDIHRSNYEHEQPGHPVHTLKLENKVLSSLLNDEIKEDLEKLKKGDWSEKNRLENALKDLFQLEKHYARKETLIFSYMEKYGISAPPKVMWGVDDAIREQMKEALFYLQDPKVAFNPLDEKLTNLINEIEEMIFKEEEIMIPMCLDVFSLTDWDNIAKDSLDIGFSFIPEPLVWHPSKEALEKEIENEPLRLANIERAKMTTEAIQTDLKENISEEKHYDWEQEENTAEQIVFPTGILQLEQLWKIFEVLPVDLTFVDNEDRVRFYSESHHRVFPRTKSVVGRAVVNCHPPKSMSTVQKILDDFRAHERTEASFWINLHGKMMVYIRYFALYNENNDYLGCLEVTQDITEIQQLEGQRRLLDE